MVARSSESCIHFLAIVGFARSKGLSTAFNKNPVPGSRPFDAQRDDFAIGEGEMTYDHEGALELLSGMICEACEAPKLEVSSPNFMTQGVS